MTIIENPSSNNKNLTTSDQTDLLALKKIFPFPEINYVDVTRQEQLKQSLERWPLLNELANVNQRELS